MDSTGRGLRVSVYRNNRGDCTLNGISSTADELTIVGVYDERNEAAGIVELEDGSRVFAPGVDAPAVVLVKRYVGGLGLCFHLAPLAQLREGRRGMMGGNYAATSDSRLSRLVGGSYGALPVHDRFEGGHTIVLVPR